MAARDVANVEVTGSNPVTCTDETKEKFIECYSKWKRKERMCTYQIIEGDNRYEIFDERRECRRAIKIVKKIINNFEK